MAKMDDATIGEIIRQTTGGLSANTRDVSCQGLPSFLVASFSLRFTCFLKNQFTDTDSMKSFSFPTNDSRSLAKSSVP